MGEKKKGTKHKAEEHKNDTAGKIQQWVGSFSKTLHKTVPVLAKKVSEEANKLNEQLQKNPAFNDMKERLIEAGKKTGEKLGIAAEQEAPSKAKKTKAAKTTTKKASSGSAAAKKKNNTKKS